MSPPPVYVCISTSSMSAVPSRPLRIVRCILLYWPSMWGKDWRTVRPGQARRQIAGMLGFARLVFSGTQYLCIVSCWQALGVCEAGKGLLVFWCVCSTLCSAAAAYLGASAGVFLCAPRECCVLQRLGPGYVIAAYVYHDKG